MSTRCLRSLMISSFLKRSFLSKFYFLIIFLIISEFSPILAQEYVLIWGDEFNTPGMPDTTIWQYEKGFIRNNELQYYTVARPENARIEDTLLILEARKENYAGASYTSASLTSRGIGDWKYGKIEIRAKVPTGLGTWPALWMMPTYNEYGGWPKSGEIDIMEYIGVEPEDLYYTCHFEGTNGTGHQSSSNNGSTAIWHPYEQFIKFCIIWTPDKIEWFANDVKYHEYNRPSDDYRVWPFNREFYMIMNLAYGGSWGGYGGVDDSLLPHKFFIDYVRVYQLRDSEGPFTLNILPAEGGSVTKIPDLETYPDNTVVTLTATSDDNYVFKSWKHMSRANPYTFTIRKDMVIKPLFIDKNEYILNGKFDENWYNWIMYIFDPQTASFTPGIVDSCFVLDITQSPGVSWQAGFQQYGLSIDTGYYDLRFDAHAEMAADLFISVAKNYPDWGTYISRNQPVTLSPTTYELNFQMPVKEDNARLFFGIGNFSGKFYIDNISLKRTFGTITGVSEQKSSPDLVNCYPNPVKDLLTVSGTGKFAQTPLKIQLIDVLGNVLSTKIAAGMETTLDLSMFRPGVYFVKIDTPASSVTKKILRL